MVAKKNRHPKPQFNEVNGVGKVLSSEIIDLRSLKKRLDRIDLRFFRTLYLSDTYDGKHAPAEGYQYRAVLYGNRVVWDLLKYYQDGMKMGRRERGSVFYFRMSRISDAFLKIAESARRQFFRERPRKGLSVEERKNANLVYISDDDLKILREHPQYQDAVDRLGTKLEPTIHSGNYRIIATKREPRRVN